MKYREFYSELGKLLYAIAKSDGIVNKKEEEKLHEIVKEELVPEEEHTDSFGTDAAWYTEIEFDFAEEEMLDPQYAFDSFINYLNEHHTAFDDKMKNVCIRVSKELADSYYGTNKKEKEMLSRLIKKLDEIFPGD